MAAMDTDASAGDLISRLYSFVDENVNPLPRAWSISDRDQQLAVSHNNLRLSFKGTGKTLKDAAAIRTPHPIPAACGLYYFEVRVVSKGRDGHMGIGLCNSDVGMNRLPGWERGSWGYHGDDGFFFCSSGSGTPYGPSFTTGDVVGCGYNLVDSTIFYTKNGQHLGTAYTELPPKLYPTVGLQTPREVLETNFGQEPFVYQIEREIAATQLRVRSAIHGFNLPSTKVETFQRLVSSYLAHEGFVSTAECFNNSTGLKNSESPTSMRNRQKIYKLVMAGRISDAIGTVNALYPELFTRNPRLLFLLKCRQFVEMVSGADNEMRRSPRSLSASPAASPPHRTGMVGSASTGTRRKAWRAVAEVPSRLQLSVHPHTVLSADAPGQSSASNGHVANGTTAGLEHGAPVAGVADDVQNGQYENGSSVDRDQDNDTSPEEEFMGTISSAETDDGLLHGSSSLGPHAAQSSTVLVANAAPVVNTRLSCTSNVEKLVNFGTELNKAAECLEGVEPQLAQSMQMKMQEAFYLLAHGDPWTSPLRHLLDESQREPYADALNCAVLELLGERARPPLSTVWTHATNLRHVFATHDIGAAAFIAPASVADDQRAAQCAEVNEDDAERLCVAATAASSEHDVAAVDVNMGCPKAFSLKGGMGAALLRPPRQLAESILTALVRGLSVPVTCKVRVLNSDEETIEMVRRFAACGISAIAVHGRRVTERQKDPNRDGLIAKIAAAVDIPVIANGGSGSISCHEDVVNFRKRSGASSVMLARAALRNVSIFKRDGVLENGEEVLRKYLRYCWAYKAEFQYTKYVLQRMLGERQQTCENGRKTLSAATMKELLRVWGVDCSDQVPRAAGDEAAHVANGTRLFSLTKKRQAEDGVAALDIEIPVKRLKVITKTGGQSPKSVLNEYCRKQNWKPPTYIATGREGDQRFAAIATVNCRRYTSSKWHVNKRLSEQAAALVCMHKLGIRHMLLGDWEID